MCLSACGFGPRSQSPLALNLHFLMSLTCSPEGLGLFASSRGVSVLETLVSHSVLFPSCKGLPHAERRLLGEGRREGGDEHTLKPLLVALVPHWGTVTRSPALVSSPRPGGLADWFDHSHRARAWLHVCWRVALWVLVTAQRARGGLRVSVYFRLESFNLELAEFCSFSVGTSCISIIRHYQPSAGW